MAIHAFVSATLRLAIKLIYTSTDPSIGCYVDNLEIGRNVIAMDPTQNSVAGSLEEPASKFSDEENGCPTFQLQTIYSNSPSTSSSLEGSDEHELERIEHDSSVDLESLDKETKILHVRSILKKIIEDKSEDTDNHLNTIQKTIEIIKVHFH